MASQLMALFFFIILASTKPAISISTSTPLYPTETAISITSSSIQTVLLSHALPIGLFPKSISGFSLDPSSGRFKLQVSNSPCSSKFETQVRYDRNITGILSFGQISQLSGVAAQDLFLWLPVNDIQVDVPSSGLIYFDVGVVSKQFSLSFFDTPQDCAGPAGEEVADDDHRDDKFSKPLDLSFLKYREHNIKTASDKYLKQRSKGHQGKAAS